MSTATAQGLAWEYERTNPEREEREEWGAGAGWVSLSVIRYGLQGTWWLEVRFDLDPESGVTFESNGDTFNSLAEAQAEGERIAGRLNEMLGVEGC